MSRDIKRPARKGSKAGPSGRDAPLPRFIPPQLSQPVEKPPSGPQWLHEIKLDGYRMAARIDNGRVQTPDSDRARVDRQISQRHCCAGECEGARRPTIIRIFLMIGSFEEPEPHEMIHSRNRCSWSL